LTIREKGSSIDRMGRKGRQKSEMPEESTSSWEKKGNCILLEKRSKAKGFFSVMEKWSEEGIRSLQQKKKKRDISDAKKNNVRIKRGEKTVRKRQREEKGEKTCRKWTTGKRQSCSHGPSSATS